MGVTSASDDVDEQGGAREAPTQAFVAAAASDRCAHCGSHLAADQRYCVNCGERRGKARFPVATMAAAQSRPVTEEKPAGPPPRSRMSSGSTLVAGIGTLLLAMGVGVLIGRANTQPTQRASAPAQIITVGGGGGSAGTTGPVATAHHKSKPAKTVTASQGKGKPPIFKTVVVTKQALTKANNNLSTVVPTQNLAPATVTTPGQACASGAGCQGGKFTGNFFGQ